MNLQGRPKSPVKFRDGGGISRAGKSQTVDFTTLLTPAKNAPVVAGKKLEEPSTAGKKFSLQNPGLKGNALDSSIPTKLRGKEKALPKPKKPSALRKAILQSRQSEGATLKAAASSSPSPAWIDPPDSSSVHSSKTLQASCEEFSARGSATSPLSPEMETTCDPSSKTSSTLRKFPDRAFYCQHLITTEVSTLAGDILDKLVFYQDRAYHQDPALYKRRFVCGFKDVVKHIDTKEIRLIFLASDLERVDEPGGISDQLEKIRRKAEEFHVPVVFVGKRRMLARKCRKPHVVSVVGIYNYDVAGTEVKRLLALGQEEEGKQTGRQTDSQADR
ncbi:putative Selenocysteine insertion sequence-binding protein 2-like [Hypsibius exemplaris]|uniref:Selenocysteine insertion sequence-binding protein 2-like n=1 Tax=Hypsibius exemplaris TaxID=2072580 RepID=A0A9X6NJB4_HYPEX|nr:putative Selenocysteine insertion sequence-binding protein 2-like [Hypsibius exemplaris]